MESGNHGMQYNKMSRGTQTHVRKTLRVVSTSTIGNAREHELRFNGFFLAQVQHCIAVPRYI
jgi:hypothetical protein